MSENKMIPLPTIADLTMDIQQAFKQDDFNLLLNQEVPVKWVKENKFANNSKYIPIDKVEFLLTRIFGQWRVEIIDYKQLFNAVSCHIRLHYLNPVTNQWSYHDGVGAMQVQTKSGSSPADLASINNSAVMMALPAAKSYAIKDAADHLGKLFGRDLNRKDVQAFVPAFDEETKKRINEDLKKRYNGTGAENK